MLNKVYNINSKNLEIAEDFIEINGTKHYFNEAEKYNSGISFSAIDNDDFYKNLSIVAGIIKNYSPEKSLAFLIDARRKKYFNSSFGQKFVERVLKGWSAFREKKYIEGARMFKGTGYGFTPGGDDFLAGFLTGLYLQNRVKKDPVLRKNVVDIMKVIYRTGRTGNVITDNFLRFANEGCFYEKTKNLLLALIGKDETAVKENTHRMINFGETSGADLTTGLICALTRIPEI